MKIESDILKTAAVVAILAGVYGGLVFWPTQKQNKAMADTVQTKQAELSAMTRPDLAPLTDEIATLKAELAERVIELPKGDLDDRVLQHVSETLIGQGVTLYETSYREPKFYKRFAVAPIDVSFSTSFPKAFEIIHRIETAGPPVRIERIELSGKPDETNGYVAVTMQLSSFFIPTKQGGATMKRKLNRFWRQLTADKKKFGMFVAVLAVGLLLWGRLMFLEKVPKVATADPKAKTDQKQNTEQKNDNAENPSEVVLPSLGEVRVDLSHDLALDLFTFRHNRYKPLPEGETGPDGVQPVNPGDDEALRRRMLEELRNSLSLQSVIQGPRPAIVVNGRIVRVGGSIEGFKVVAVFDRSATMSREGLEFTLTMTSE